MCHDTSCTSVHPSYSCVVIMFDKSQQCLWMESRHRVSLLVEPLTSNYELRPLFSTWAEDPPRIAVYVLSFRKVNNIFSRSLLDQVHHIFNRLTTCHCLCPKPTACSFFQPSSPSMLSLPLALLSLLPLINAQTTVSLFMPEADSRSFVASVISAVSFWILAFCITNTSNKTSGRHSDDLLCRMREHHERRFVYSHRLLG